MGSSLALCEIREATITIRVHLLFVTGAATVPLLVFVTIARPQLDSLAHLIQ